VAGAGERQQELAPCQLSFWLIERMHPGTGGCNASVVFHLRGELEPELLEQALGRSIDRHEPLRTRFEELSGMPRARVESAAPWALEVVDLRVLSEAERAAEADRLVRERARTPFDLGRAPLFSALLLRIGDREHRLLVKTHHLVTDGFSLFHVLPRELSAIYAALRGSTTLPDPPAARYSDFVRRQIDESTGERLERHLAFWRSELAGAPAAIDLPFDRPRQPGRSIAGRRASASIPREILQRIDALAAALEAHRATIFLTAWAAVLARASGQPEILIGSPSKNRDDPSFEALFGCFVDDLILRIDVSGAPTFRELARRVRVTLDRVRPHRMLPSRTILDSLSAPRAGAHPFYQVVFNYMPFSIDSSSIEGLEVTAERVPPESCFLDLSLEVAEKREQIELVLEHSSDLFDRSTAERLLSHVQTLLLAAIDSPDRSIESLPLMTSAERGRIVAFSRGPTISRESRSLPAIIEETARGSPEAVALRARGTSIHYRTLARRTAAWTAALRARGLERGERCAILLRDPSEAICAILGAMAAGAAIVPIDPDVPPERRRMILDDASPALIVDEGLDARQEGPTEQSAIEPSDPAYVLYTSGSTGRPKGVVILHGSLSQQHAARCARYPDPPGTFLLTYSLSFDAGLAGMFWTLATGGTLVVVDDEARRDPRRIRAEIDRERVTHLDLVPSMYSALLEDARPEELATVRQVVLGGEVLTPSLAIEHSRLIPKVRLFNEYGPTEATVFATVHEVTPEAIGHRVPIGMPIANTTCLVLERSGELAPIGYSGEICIAGPGVAAGYLSEPNSERFVTGLHGCDRVYRTGDRGRWLEGGTLEISGRMDRQVKLRGLRIELGEIEAALSSVRGVRQAAALLREDSGSRRLVGYVSGTDLPPMPEIRRQLRARLPEPSVPAIVVLDELPRGPTGKVLFEALPAPEPELEGRVAPRDPLEERLAAIWRRVLGVPMVGVHDGFFDLGGSSISAAKMLAEIDRELQASVPFAAFLSGATVAELAVLLSGLGARRHSVHPGPLDPVQPRGARPPLFFIGSMRYARALGAAIGEDQPLYGLNIFALRPEDQSELEVEVVARSYVAEIRKLQPRGPYQLAGYCADAKVAFEMAHQLRAMGEEIGFLGFIDSVWWAKIPRWRVLADNLLEFGPDYVKRRALRKSRDWRFRIDYAVAELKKAVMERADGKIPREVREHVLIRRFNAALERYEPQSFDGRIDLFLASEWGAIDLDRLSKIASRGVYLWAIHGYHDNLFEPPQLTALAAEIRRRLDAAASLPGSAGILR
jgi:amino acid adenylation domain-containing protein